MEKSRKSKKALIVAAMALMVALVIGMGAMTYSRYITTGTSNATATAAKWGFVITADASNLFGSDYTLSSGATTATRVEGNGVAVNSTANVVAPGTSGSMTISIDGQAEVLAQLTFAMTCTSDIGIDYTSGDDYYPIKWTLEKDNEIVEGANGVGFTAFADILAAQSSQIDIGGSLTDVYTISWEWPLNAADIEASAKDTLIGQHANDSTTSVEGGSISSTLAITLSVTIEQIQAPAQN